MSKPDMGLNENKSAKDREILTDRFSIWLEGIRHTQKTGQTADVPCGECTACCTSSYFIHIKPHELTTIAKIPKGLMFPAPGLPKGNVLLGFNEKGHCPMFIDNKCSIYDYRPQTCRVYDCRILTASGLHPGDDKMKISRQVDRWRFNYTDDSDRQYSAAVRAAAEFINKYAESFPAGFIPVNAPQRAMIAVKVYHVFLNFINKNETTVNSDPGIIQAVIDAFEKFERDENI